MVLLCLYSCSGLKVSDQPEAVTLVTSDISNFYQAFDKALQDTTKAEETFRNNYFKLKSRGLRDFYKLKIGSVRDFSNVVIRHQEVYKAIRKDVLDLSDLEDEILHNFGRLEQIYPSAKFPDIYFVIGRFTSNGTISKNGLLIGTEVLSRTPHTDTTAWSPGIRRIIMQRSHIPVTLSHELVHFNQEKMKDGNTLLWKSIREGSAEFIAELISGETDADYSDFEGREMEIWQDFQKEMHKSIWSSWQQQSEERPRNAGYWMGYTICKAYYEQVRNKEKAVMDILSIQDYSVFLENSKVEEYLHNNFGE